MTTGSCLCGAVKFEAESPYKWLSYCHCGMCRKHHGTFHGVFVAADKERFRFIQGEDDIVHYRASPASAFERPFCKHCGSKVPEVSGDYVGIPAGLLDEIDTRHRMHIFVAHKSPMESITDDFKQFDDYPPGAGSAMSTPAPIDTSSGTHGGCLCGSVAFSIDNAPSKIVQCHCSRCRRTRGTAHGVNTFVRQDQLHFTRGADRVKTFKPNDAERFSTSFCVDCGGLLPALFAPMQIYLVPVGSLDAPFDVKGVVNIYVGSKAPWFAITNPHPQYDELPPREWFREFLFG